MKYVGLKALGAGSPKIVYRCSMERHMQCEVGLCENMWMGAPVRWPVQGWSRVPI